MSCFFDRISILFVDKILRKQNSKTWKKLGRRSRKSIFSNYDTKCDTIIVTWHIRAVFILTISFLCVTSVLLVTWGDLGILIGPKWCHRSTEIVLFHTARSTKIQTILFVVRGFRPNNPTSEQQCFCNFANNPSGVNTQNS